MHSARLLCCELDRLHTESRHCKTRDGNVQISRLIAPSAFFHSLTFELCERLFFAEHEIGFTFAAPKTASDPNSSPPLRRGEAMGSDVISWVSNSCVVARIIIRRTSRVSSCWNLN